MLEGITTSKQVNTVMEKVMFESGYRQNGNYFRCTVNLVNSFPKGRASHVEASHILNDDHLNEQ